MMTKKMAIPIITVFLTIMCFALLLSDLSIDSAFWLTLLGSGLGWLYIFRKGTLPPWLYRSCSGVLNSDDDASNIPAKLYLPIIMLAVMIALGMLYAAIK